MLQFVPAEAAELHARRGRGGGHGPQHHPHFLALTSVHRPDGRRSAFQHNQSRLRIYSGNLSSDISSINIIHIYMPLILQAPESMKSVVQALYLLTTAIGNLIDFVVAAVLSGVNTKQVGFPVSNVLSPCEWL